MVSKKSHFEAALEHFGDLYREPYGPEAGTHAAACRACVPATRDPLARLVRRLGRGRRPAALPVPALQHASAVADEYMCVWACAREWPLNFSRQKFVLGNVSDLPCFPIGAGTKS